MCSLHSKRSKLQVRIITKFYYVFPSRDVIMYIRYRGAEALSTCPGPFGARPPSVGQENEWGCFLIYFVWDMKAREGRKHITELMPCWMCGFAAGAGGTPSPSIVSSTESLHLRLALLALVLGRLIITRYLYFLSLSQRQIWTRLMHSRSRCG